MKTQASRSKLIKHGKAATAEASAEQGAPVPRGPVPDPVTLTLPGKPPEEPPALQEDTRTTLPTVSTHFHLYVD